MRQVSRLGVCALVLYVGTATALLTILGAMAKALAASPHARAAISYPNANPRVAPLWIAQDLDFFSKYGIRGDVVFVRNNQTLIAGIAAGDIDVGYTGGATVIGAAAGGIDLKVVSAFVRRGRGYLVGRPEIAAPGDLRGKRIGVISIGGAQWMYAMLALEQFGLNSAKDRIQFVIIGDPTALARALEAQLIAIDQTV